MQRLGGLRADSVPPPCEASQGAVPGAGGEGLGVERAEQSRVPGSWHGPSLRAEMSLQ